LNKTFFFRFLF